MKAAFGAVATLSAAATLWAGGVFGSGPTSRPIFVSASCHAPPNAAACAVALRYLAALDLDRGHEACGLLDEPTLEAAGGTDGCSRTLAQARGIRIQYRVAAVNRSPLGWTVRFATWAKGDAPLRQEMLVSRRGRIVAVVPEP